MTKPLNIPKSEMKYRRRFTPDEIRAIRADYKSVWGHGYLKIAKRYGVTAMAIKKIVTRESYKHVTDEVTAHEMGN